MKRRTPHPLVLITILGVAFVRGLLYVVIVPPWQHYDEPSHFEYAWLIANRQKLPQRDEYDQNMRREVLASMYEHRFFSNMDFSPSLLTQDPVWIGFGALSHQPFYYMLAAIPLWLLRDTDIVLQLYAARLVSWLLYMLTVYVAWQVVGELVASHSPLRWLIPTWMALLPAFTDLMTAVNNDVGATALVSLFLWGAVKTIKKGITRQRLAWVLGTTALCFWTKNTAWVALVLAPIALLWGFFRNRWRWWVRSGIAAAGIAVLVAVFAWGDAACWYRSTVQQSPTGQRISATPWGKRAIAIHVSPDDPTASLIQHLTPAQVESLHGKTITLGTWIWASQPTTLYTPLVYDGTSRYGRVVVEASTTPAFYAITATLSARISQMYVQLQPVPRQSPVTVYYDGILLTEGAWDLVTAPQFQDDRAVNGVWAGKPFVNLIRNGSAESTVPRIHSWLEKPVARYGHIGLSALITSLLDWSGTAWIYPITFRRIFHSFWGRFAWNSVGLPAGWYAFLLPLSLLGVLGGGVIALRKTVSGHTPIFQRRAIFFLWLTLALVWGNTFLRGHPVAGNSYLPVARYAYPAIIPTALLLVSGWWALCPACWRRWFPLALVVLLTWLDSASLWTIVSFFYGR